MQGIEPNMDELLRKASEGYPLKASVDNWEKIAPGFPMELLSKNQQKSLYIKNITLRCCFYSCLYLWSFSF